MKSFWSDEFERMSRMVRDLMQSPAQNLLREMEQHRQLLEPPGYRALREIQDNIAADARRVTEGLTSGFSSLLGQYDVLKSIVAAQSPSSLASDLQRSLQAYQPPPLPFIESFADQLRSASRNLEAFCRFEETFAGQLLGLACKVVEASEKAIEERADDLTEFLGTHLTESKRGPISLEGYVQIVLAVLLYIYSAIGTQQSEERITKRLNTLESRFEGDRAPRENGASIRPATGFCCIAACSRRISHK
jgi:hypothetical protein